MRLVTAITLSFATQKTNVSAGEPPRVKRLLWTLVLSQGQVESFLPVPLAVLLPHESNTPSVTLAYTLIGVISGHAVALWGTSSSLTLDHRSADRKLIDTSWDHWLVVKGISSKHAEHFILKWNLGRIVFIRMFMWRVQKMCSVIVMQRVQVMLEFRIREVLEHSLSSAALILLQMYPFTQSL